MYLLDGMVPPQALHFVWKFIKEWNGIEWVNHKGMGKNRMEWIVFKEWQKKKKKEWNEVILFGCFKIKKWKEMRGM